MILLASGLVMSSLVWLGAQRGGSPVPIDQAPHGSGAGRPLAK